MDRKSVVHWIITIAAVTLATYSTYRVHALEQDETDDLQASQIFALSQDIDQLKAQLAGDASDGMPEYATTAELAVVENIAETARSDAQRAQDGVDDLDSRINLICIHTSGRLCP